LRPILAAALAALPLAATTALASPRIDGCPVFPADNVWNTPVDALPAHPNSAAFVNFMGAAKGLHMDFGSGLYEGHKIGIPFVTVPGTQPRVPIYFDEPGESDPGPYPVPPDAPVEADPNPPVDSDRHVLVVDRDDCMLYELFASTRLDDGAAWYAFSGAVFDLRSHAFRPDTWTSADAAGLPILAGLARYDEAASGVIRHALRMTTSPTFNGYVWPARHEASSNNDPAAPPMGLRLRLKAGVNIDGLSPIAKAIAQAMKTYGVIIADNGSDWYVSGAPDERWDNDVLHELDVITGADFEVVDTSSMIVDPDSGRVANPACGAGDTDGDGMTDCVDLTEGGNPAVKDNDVFASARLFAMQQYRDFLGREGEGAGVKAWTAAVASGAWTRAQAVDAFLQSPEFAGFVAPVVRLYFATFLRVPDYAGLSFNAGLVRSGAVTVAQLADFFTASPEFAATYGSLDDTQFVTLLYNNVLGRAPDGAGLAGWVSLLGSGYTRGQVLLGFSDSAEYQAAMAHEVFVTMMYAGMLRRTPEPAGFNGWVALLDGGLPATQVIDGFFLSTEYRGRFMP
jgi:hypothetical protein